MLLRGTRVVNIAPGRYAGAPLCNPRVAAPKKLSFFSSKIGPVPSADPPRTKKTKKQESRKAGKQESRKAGKLLERSGCPHIPPGGYVYNSSAGFVFHFFRFGRLPEGTDTILEEKIDNFFAAATRGGRCRALSCRFRFSFFSFW